MLSPRLLYSPYRLLYFEIVVFRQRLKFMQQQRVIFYFCGDGTDDCSGFNRVSFVICCLYNDFLWGYWICGLGHDNFREFWPNSRYSIMQKLMKNYQRVQKQSVKLVFLIIHDEFNKFHYFVEFSCSFVYGNTHCASAETQVSWEKYSWVRILTCDIDPYCPGSKANFSLLGFGSFKQKTIFHLLPASCLQKSRIFGIYGVYLIITLLFDRYCSFFPIKLIINTSWLQPCVWLCNGLSILLIISQFSTTILTPWHGTTDLSEP